MAYEIVWTDNSREDLKRIVDYLEEEWSTKIAEEFIIECYSIIELLTYSPYIGIASEKFHSVRKILITKHNALYYSVVGEKITLLDIFDTRQDPTKNLY